MKVGTDGVLLGAWAQGGTRILDIGTGTALMALMLAQRFPDAYVTGIDIDGEACQQARENVANTPFADRVEVVHQALQAFMPQEGGVYDSIVSNPPYFHNSLKKPRRASRPGSPYLRAAHQCAVCSCSPAAHAYGHAQHYCAHRQCRAIPLRRLSAWLQPMSPLRCAHHAAQDAAPLAVSFCPYARSHGRAARGGAASGRWQSHAVVCRPHRRLLHSITP